MDSLLRAKKLRVTDFRLSVLEIFNQFGHAISVDIIEEQLQDFDRITLYRTLKSFLDKGVIHEITYPQEEKKLALCSHNCSGEGHSHQHIHFKCNVCGQISCTETKAFPEISLKGFKVENIEIQASGICSSCA